MTTTDKSRADAPIDVHEAWSRYVGSCNTDRSDLQKEKRTFIGGWEAGALNEKRKLASPVEQHEAAPAASDFKNFHRLLCERFDYTHDERDWKRDQLSLIEHIAAAWQPAKVPVLIAIDLERTNWTPETALRWYADGKHFDVVNGRTRILDTGAIASNALKKLDAEYHAMKGADASFPFPAPSAPLEGTGNGADERAVFEAWYLHDMPHETYLLKRSHQHPEMYDDDSVEDAWTGWQARAAASQAATGQEVAQYQYRLVTPGYEGEWHNCSAEKARTLQEQVYPEGYKVRALGELFEPAQLATRHGLTDLLRQAREELSNVEWENDPPNRVVELFSAIDALLEGAKQ